MRVVPSDPTQGWPSVPSPKGSPERVQRADMTARRRLVLSPRSAAELRAAGDKHVGGGVREVTVGDRHTGTQACGGGR